MWALKPAKLLFFFKSIIHDQIMGKNRPSIWHYWDPNNFTISGYKWNRFSWWSDVGLSWSQLVLSYRSFVHLKFYKVIKSNFYIIHVELRNASGHLLVPFFTVVKFNLPYYSGKFLNHFPIYHQYEHSRLKWKLISCLVLCLMFLKNY